jgi:pyridoxamine 5'-phosphate oxidase
VAADDLADMRRAYPGGALREEDLAGDWLGQLARWLQDAVEAGLPEPNAMVVATADPAGVPSGRIVLLKDLDERGLSWFTNLGSRKAREALANPRACLVFPWFAMSRQVVVTGAVRRVDDEEADAYFATRPRGSQLGAHASPQSTVIPSRDVLDAARAEAGRRWPEGTPVPRPEHWGGLRLVPDAVEFWRGRADRLHDRLRFRREAGGWVVERLAP